MCECGADPTCVTDWSAGETVCTGCGVVLESCLFDEGHRAPYESEVPTYGERRAKRIRTTSSSTPAEIALGAGLRAVERFAGDAFRLGPGHRATEAAKEAYRDVCERRGGIKSDARAATAAACVHFGLKIEGAGRESRTVAARAGLEPKVLHAAIDACRAVLADRPYFAAMSGPASAAGLVDSYLDELDLPPEQRKRVWGACRRLDERVAAGMDCSRKPKTLVGGLLWLGVQAVAAEAESRPGWKRVSKADVARACGTCQQTLDKVAAGLLEEGTGNQQQPQQQQQPQYQHQQQPRLLLAVS